MNTQASGMNVDRLPVPDNAPGARTRGDRKHVRRSAIVDYVEGGGNIERYRSRHTAGGILGDFKQEFPCFKGCWDKNPVAERVAQTYIQDVIFNIAWYEKSVTVQQGRRKRWFWGYAVGLVVIPAVLYWLNLYASSPAKNASVPMATQITLILSFIALFQQMANQYIEERQRLGIWHRSRSELKTLWYATLSKWSGTPNNIPNDAGASENAGPVTEAVVAAHAGTDSDTQFHLFLADLWGDVAQARVVVDKEQQDYFDKLDKPFPGILETVAAAATTAKSLVGGLVPVAATVDSNATAIFDARKEVAKSEAVMNALNAYIDAINKAQGSGNGTSQVSQLDSAKAALVAERGAAEQAMTAAQKTLEVAKVAQQVPSPLDKTRPQ